MNTSFKWEGGIKVISIVTGVAVILSLALVLLFRNSFDLNSSIIDNFILYSLRVFVLGMFSIFGLSIAEIIKYKKETVDNEGSEHFEFSSDNNESEYVIKEAKLNAEKIIFEAEKKAQNIVERKNQIEIQLRELIQTEREVIRKYEKENEASNDKNIE